MRHKLIRRLLGMALAATPLVTTATCDPVTGTFEFFRDDDAPSIGWGHDFHDGYYYGDVVFYDDCYFFVCF